MDKRFAIFDMDGTLVDSMPVWRQLAFEYLHTKGVGEITPQMLEDIKPMTLSESAAYFIRCFGWDISTETALDELSALMDRHYRDDIACKPGIRAHLEQLQAAGVQMCVASATAKELMVACLKRLGILSCFSFLLSCEEVGAGKRQPDVYLQAAKQLQAQPEQIAVYEDALYAVQTAKQAGFYVVGVYDDAEKDHWQEICQLTDETVNFD